MSIILFRCKGGDVILPNPSLLLVTREDGGNLVINPPRTVWERSELNPDELTHWAFLVSATGRAMIDVLPQLEGGCINYWEAGNWALNQNAEPVGPKTARAFRKVHLHLLGRSRNPTHPGLMWGESPKFPEFADRLVWSSGFQRLTVEECRRIIGRTKRTLTDKFGMPPDEMSVEECEGCGYPSISPRCQECDRA